MTRSHLQLLLSSALLAALSPACGGNVAPDAVLDDVGSDAGEDVATDAAVDTAACRPITDNAACSERVTYPCGLPIAVSDAGPSTDECKTLCAPIEYRAGMTAPMYCSTWPDDAGVPTVYCPSCAVGRKPADLLDRDSKPNGEDPIATTLAEMARVEAASVHAFRRLDRVLCALGVDGDVRQRVRSAARDEVAHARRVGGLARARGVRPLPVRLRRDTPSVFDLALENAVEGCVHETLGVAYLEHQRVHAEDPELRALAASLYEDELAHAALSWELRAVFDAHLSDEQRAVLDAATERALDAVVDEIGRVDRRVVRAFGLPSRATVARLVATLRGTLFPSAANPETIAA